MFLRGQSELAEEHFGCHKQTRHNWHSGGCRSEMPLNNVQSLGQMSTTKNYLAQNLGSAETEKPSYMH